MPPMPSQEIWPEIVPPVSQTSPIPFKSESAWSGLKSNGQLSTSSGISSPSKSPGAVTQSPLMMGYYAIYALTAAANGQELEDVPTDGYWYDSTNMDSEEIAPNLYD